MISIDSNALTYLIEAQSPGYAPEKDTDAHAEERLAMLRIFLYTDKQLYIPSSVETEYKRIPDDLKKMLHERICQIHLHDDTREYDATILKARKDEFLKYHSKEKDCQIVAETELAGICVLLTRDEDLRKHLPARTNVAIFYPSEYWEYLSIPQGSEPKQHPPESNHLSKVDWWKW